MAEDKTPKPLRWWLRLLLLVSLGLNLAIAGVLIGAFLRFGPPGHDKRPPRQDEIAGAFTRALSHEDRRAIGRQLRDAHRDQGGSRAQFRAELQRMAAALRQADFDAEEVAEILSRQRAFGMQRAELGHQLLLQHLQQMSPEDRAAFAARLEAGLTRKRGDKRDGGRRPADGRP